MTVKRGSEWGERVSVPSDALPVATDADAAAAIGRKAQRPVVLRGGDLFRTLGGPATGLRVPIDVIDVAFDGVAGSAVAHVVARRAGRLGWWRGPAVAVMNAQYIGRWDVAPRSHPNDGRLDVVEMAGTMSVRARWQAWRRLPTGSHVPHPDILTRRTAEATFTFDRPLGLWVDGVARGPVRSLTVRVVPDATEVYV
jgi:hypothetical protein